MALARPIQPDHRAKLAALYQRYKGLLFHLAQGILQNHHEAEEVVHDSFLAALETMDKLDEVDSPRTRAYLVTIAQNKAIDRYRQRRPQGPLPPDLPDPGSLEEETEDGLTRCILRLPQRERQVILLRFDQGYSPKETAALLGLSLGATYKLEQRAKKKLEALCQKEGIS